ncbi:MAG: hypothetical protein D6797_07920 [Bdellovibrio sp.]|nr:MAG: hypothetical protein D6797_07920 [Bdellovibrio sp.]
MLVDIFNKQSVTSQSETDIKITEHLLSFQVGESLYAVTFESVQEVIDYIEFTEYPVKDKRYVGIINLRGSIVSIINPFLKEFDKEDSSLFQKKYIIFDTPKKQLK